MFSTNLPEIVASVSTAERAAKRAGESALKVATKELQEEAWKLVKARYHRLPKSADKEGVRSHLPGQAPSPACRNWRCGIPEDSARRSFY